MYNDSWLKTNWQFRYKEEPKGEILSPRQWPEMHADIKRQLAAKDAEIARLKREDAEAVALVRNLRDSLIAVGGQLGQAKYALKDMSGDENADKMRNRADAWLKAHEKKA